MWEIPFSLWGPLLYINTNMYNYLKQWSSQPTYLQNKTWLVISYNKVPWGFCFGFFSVCIYIYHYISQTMVIESVQVQGLESSNTPPGVLPSPRSSWQLAPADESASRRHHLPTIRISTEYDTIDASEIQKTTVEICGKPSETPPHSAQQISSPNLGMPLGPAADATAKTSDLIITGMLEQRTLPWEKP